MREMPMYNGAGARAPQRPQPELPRVEMPRDPRADVIPQAVKDIEGVVHQYAEVKDFQMRMEAERQRSIIGGEFKEEMRRRAELPWGSDGSLFRHDGSMNHDAVRGLAVQYQERMLGTRQGYWLRENDLKQGEELKGANAKLELDAWDMVGRMERQNIEQSFRDTYELMLARDDIAGAHRAVEGAVQRGLITSAKGEAMKLRLAKRSIAGRVSGGGGVRLGGREFTGLDAQLAIAAARERSGEESKVVAGAAKAGPEGGTQESASLTQTAVADGGAPDGQLTLPFAAWANGDDAPCLRASTASEVEQLNEWLVPPVQIATAEREDGTMATFCPSTAPDCVQRAVLLADRDGCMGEDATVSMVGGIALDQYAQNADLPMDSFLKLFEGTQTFAVLGRGDAEVGRNRARALAEQYKQRSLEATGKLSLKHIEGMVERFLDEMPESQGLWGDFAMNVASGASFNRRVTRPASKDERAAMKDYYMSAIALELARQTKRVDTKTGRTVYAGYADEVGVVKSVLSRGVPKRLGVQELEELKRAMDEQVEVSREQFRRMSAGHYDRLREEKAAAKEAGAKKASSADRAEREAEKKAEHERKVSQARFMRTMRSTPWKWMENNDGDSEPAWCTIPEELARELEEKGGYDWEKTVYLNVDGKNIPVVGTNGDGCIMMNSKAAAIANGKLKKGQELRASGTLGYNLTFTKS